MEGEHVLRSTWWNGVCVEGGLGRTVLFRKIPDAKDHQLKVLYLAFPRQEKAFHPRSLLPKGKQHSISLRFRPLTSFSISTADICTNLS
jgi:hypothetical protein